MPSPNKVKVALTKLDEISDEGDLESDSLEGAHKGMEGKDSRLVYRVCVTGGPSGGKTTS